MTLTTLDKNAIKGRKPIVKLSWELLTPFSDFMRTLPTQQNRNDDDEDEDDDELQAHQDSMQRLRVRSAMIHWARSLIPSRTQMRSRRR